MTDPFVLPAYLEPYRSSIWIDNGMSVESIVNAGTQHASFDDAVRQVSVLHQLRLLRSLMASGLLLVAVPQPQPKRGPSKATKAKRAKRRR